MIHGLEDNQRQRIGCEKSEYGRVGLILINRAILYLLGIDLEAENKQLRYNVESHAENLICENNPVEGRSGIGDHFKCRTKTSCMEYKERNSEVSMPSETFAL